MLSKEDIEMLEKIEAMSPQQKSAHTKMKKYSKEERDEWSRKGGQKRNSKKGFGTHPDNTGGRIKQRANNENSRQS